MDTWKLKQDLETALGLRAWLAGRESMGDTAAAAQGRALETVMQAANVELRRRLRAEREAEEDAAKKGDGA